MGPTPAAWRRSLLAALLLPWQSLPALGQTRVAALEAPVAPLSGQAGVVVPAPLAAPGAATAGGALANGLTLGPALPPALAPAAAAAPELAAASKDLAASAGAKGGTGLASRALASRSAAPAEAPAPNRFLTKGLARVLAELASFAAPAPADAVLAPARAAEEPPALDRPSGAVADEPGRVPIPESRRWLRDAWLYSSIYLSSLYWYTGPRLVERWAEIREKLGEAGGRPRAVKDIKGFFIAHRVLGSTGSYSPLGFRVASQRLVVHDALAIYDRYFVDDEKARAAFLGLMQRAERYNPNRRSTQFRKALFHALREAAVLEPSQVAAFFDSQLGRKKASELERYQRDAQPQVLAAFDEAVNGVILELNRTAETGSRVIGALLLGSFANGAAGPGSDLDVQAISEDGSARYNDEFIKRLKARWKSGPWSDNPVSTFQYALPLSKPLITRVHREPYMIFSPYPEVRRATTRSPDEEKADQPSRIRTIRGWLFQKLYSALLWMVLGVYDAQQALRGH